ncbi:MAG: chromosome segregation protein SMC [Candidatus Hydrogenedentes bacterium]|nr:chromosome segregation protein SMC [Candidatus Hydrogenedentota bacterium]
MYFKQLELIGFKSFADRTILKLDPGVTAVVGPNGCGKSNILDSLRWVLGEQRAKELRGSNMQDIVFNGSENRHPLGMAEVSVTFDNSDSSLPVDFSEVQITRRIYRSGESEYFINKAACRLKDIHELFMDTGIGTQAYSMIGQGKMDMILSSKPEDRRFIFEEAAGIIKYKNRKRLAVRRLESAEQNLLRLGDIIAEVERQMRSLKRQVNAAIRYRELSDQLREIEIRAAWLEFVRLTSEIEILKHQFADSTDRYEKVSTRISGLEARHEEVNLNRLEVERVRLARQQGVYEIESEMEKIERQIALQRQQIEYCGEKIEAAAQEKEALIQRAAALDEQVANTGSQAGEVGSAIEGSNSEIAQKIEAHAQTAAEVADLEARLEAMRARHTERVTDRARAQTALEKLHETIEGVDRQLSSIYERQRTVASRHEELLASLETARRAESEKQQALAALEHDREQTVTARQRDTDVLRDVDEQWRTSREEKSSLEARLNSLRELRDNYEGFAIGVRAVMKAASKNMMDVRDIIGPVGDLLSSDKEYEQAIEAALGGNINNVVVENAEAAKSAIEFLKRTGAGRVTFLPLDTVRGHGRADRGDSNAPYDDGKPGVVGQAIDFVRYEARLQHVVEYLLHNTIIVNTLDDAIRITRSCANHPRLVTLDGEVVSSAGAVTGGRTKHESRGLLGRSAEIGELEKRVAYAEKKIVELAERRKTTTENIARYAEEISAIDGRLKTCRQELNVISVDHARQAAELDSMVQSGQALDRERDELRARRDQLDSERQEALARADASINDDELLQQELAEAQDAASHARQRLSVLTSELSDIRLKQAGLAQRLEEIEREKQRLLRERADAMSEAERRDGIIEQLNQERTDIEQNIALHVERSVALSETREEASKKAVDAQNQLQTLLDESETIEKELKHLREEARASQSEVHRTELALRQNEDRVGFFQERIISEYNVALASLTEEQVGTDEYDADTRTNLVNEIRGKLQRMGEVNLMAIEEYEALEQRHAFLLAQSQDLHQAKDALLGVIERSDKRIREMFLDTFNRIAENFSAFFRRLFNGGQARVYLLNEDDPLESGIEIEARPPGKKPTSISLLSGGESAMTAVALLFSIFKAKPSPFCVLDEVDAPLDDANIGRFLGIIDEFTDQSQFIVITHNKQTMAKANALYGVTMQERGVSQLVSVKMNGV